MLFSLYACVWSVLFAKISVFLLCILQSPIFISLFGLYLHMLFTFLVKFIVSAPRIEGQYWPVFYRNTFKPVFTEGNFKVADSIAGQPTTLLSVDGVCMHKWHF